MLLTSAAKHPGEKGAWEFTHLGTSSAVARLVEGIGTMKKKFVVSTLSNGNVALLINMAKHSGIPGTTASGRTRSITTSPIPNPISAWSTACTSSRTR